MGDPFTIGAFVLLLIFGGVEHHQKEKAQYQVAQLEEKLDSVKQLSEKNADAAIAAANSSKQNEETANVISQRLDECVSTVEEYKKVESDYKDDIDALKLNSKALADRINNTDLNQCRVPSWLVDEIAGDADRD